jgi:hypothetical protein
MPRKGMCRREWSRKGSVLRKGGAAKPWGAAEGKKEEFQGNMEHAASELLPQICVVSETSMSETFLSCKGTQGHNILVIRNR